MSEIFDFYNYKKELEAFDDIKIDLSGLNLKGDAQTVYVDPDTGEVSDINLNEIIDERVNLIFTGDDVKNYHVTSKIDLDPQETEADQDFGNPTADVIDKNKKGTDEGNKIVHLVGDIHSKNFVCDQSVEDGSNLKYSKYYNNRND